MNPTIAIVARDERIRLAIVKAFDRAPHDWILELHRDTPEHADVVVCGEPNVCEGAIVFDGDADALLASIAERMPRSDRTIVVTSPSGGTGATSVAVHLAAELAGRGHTAGVVDLGPHAGVRARLGLDPADREHLPVPVAGGFRLLSSMGEGAGFDRLVVDAPRERVSEIGTADAGVLVCSPSLEGARRAALMSQELPRADWLAVTNRLGPGGETTRARFERVVDRPVLELPCCAALRDAEDECRLLTRGWTRWARGIARLASQLDAI